MFLRSITMTFIFSLLPLAIASSANTTAAFVELDSLLHLSNLLVKINKLLFEIAIKTGIEKFVY